MEERRLEGGRLLKAGKLTQAEVARQLGVSRATVSDWAKKVEAEGIRGLRKRTAKGGTSKLTNEQKQRLKRLLDRGALANNFSTDRWTLERARQLIQREFGVTYHRNYLNRFLRQLGFSLQKPLPQAIEQDQELVEAWLQPVDEAARQAGNPAGFHAKCDNSAELSEHGRNPSSLSFL